MFCAAASGKENKSSSKRNGASSKAATAPDSPAAVVVEMPTEGEPTPGTLSPGETTPVSNGVVPSGRNGVPPSGHTRNASSGSGQMRPTSLRELPDLPVGSSHKRNLSGPGGAEGSSAMEEEKEEEEDGSGYDHLGAKIPTSSSSAINYDHIHLESPRDLSSGTTPPSEPDTASEGHYAQVRERTYDVVKDVRARASAKVTTSVDYDPYTKMKDEEDDKEEDTYAKVKDTEKEDVEDPDYSHLKHDHHHHTITAAPTENLTTATATSTIQDDEDPYERVVGDSGGAKVVLISDAHDNPYSVVSDQASATVVSFSGSTGASPLRAGAEKSGWNGAASSAEAADGFRLQYADEDGDAQDDYATVVKDRSAGRGVVAGGEGGGGAPARGGGVEEEQEEEGDETDPYFTTPPEPPRLYGEGEIGRIFHLEGQGQSVRSESHEHRYSKVTARESLASMSARNALNTYEVVPDLPENTYATVEGGSGDGVVRYATPGAPNLQLNFTETSETYAEIGASGSGGYAVPAPEPPSLHTLHSMTKSTTSSIDGDHGNNRPPPPSPSNVVIADDGYAVVSKSGFSPSETALPQIPASPGTSGGVGGGGGSGGGGGGGSQGEERVIGGVTLHTDYHSVKDCLPEQDNENDPNYESVDEALSKSPPGGSASAAVVGVSSSSSSTPVHSITITTPRAALLNHATSPSRVRHQYEEVSPPSSPQASPASTNKPAEGAAASNGSSSNGASSNGDPNLVRDRVLEGHMYEDISEVKKRNGAGKTGGSGGKKGNMIIHSVKL
ncbi:hypothetical protein ACOMHN_011101 [Nucella lapillus]